MPIKLRGTTAAQSLLVQSLMGNSIIALSHANAVYRSEGSLNQHIRLKHYEYFQEHIANLKGSLGFSASKYDYLQSMSSSNIEVESDLGESKSDGYTHSSDAKY
jgi:hypothetical protein